MQVTLTPHRVEQHRELEEGVPASSPGLRVHGYAPFAREASRVLAADAANAEAMAPPAPTLFLCAARGKDIVLTLTEELEGRFGGNRFDELPEGDTYPPETHHYPNVVIVLI